jgi:hypothetical protein
MTTEAFHLINVRLPAALAERLAAAVAAQRADAANPPTRSHVLREALARGLDALEREARR